MDAGRFQLRLKAPTGTRIEKTEAIVKDVLDSDPRGGRRGRGGDLGRLRGPDPVELPDQRDLPVDRRAGGGVPSGGVEGGGGRGHRGAQASAPRTPRRGDARREVLVRAGRHRQRRHELRLAHARRGRRERAELRREQSVRREGPRRTGGDPDPSRRALRPGARLSDGQREDRPREGGAQRRHGRGDRAIAGHGHVVEPLRRAELLARPEVGHRLPGAGRDPVPDHGLGGGHRDHPDPAPGRSVAAPARRGRRGALDDARRV